MFKLFNYFTFSPAGCVALQSDALFVVFDPQHAALLCTRCILGAPGQDHPDLPAIHVQVSPLPHIHVLKFELLGNMPRERILASL